MVESVGLIRITENGGLNGKFDMHRSNQQMNCLCNYICFDPLVRLEKWHLVDQ